MAANEKKKPNLNEIDFRDLASRLRLGIGQAAALCDVSIRQLSYWSDKGIIVPAEDEKSRSYDYEALEKISLIKQAIDLGFSLEGAVTEADAFLKRRKQQQSQIENMPENELEQLVLTQANQLQTISDKIRREIRSYRMNGKLQDAATSLAGVHHLISFFEENPYTVNTSRQIAIRLGREMSEVERELQLLEEQHFVQKISYPGSDVFRYIPQRH